MQVLTRAVTTSSCALASIPAFNIPSNKGERPNKSCMFAGADARRHRGAAAIPALIYLATRVRDPTKAACVQVLTRGDNEELCYCLLAWQALPQAIQCGASPDRSDALRATAVVDRLRRALGELSNDVVERLEPVSTAIGRSCGIESWAVDLFAEEVVRGGPAFAVSLVLSTVEPALRRAAELGSWQIISPNNVTGAPLLFGKIFCVFGVRE